MTIGLLSRLHGPQFSSKFIDIFSEESAYLDLHFHTKVLGITCMFDKIQQKFNKYPFFMFLAKITKTTSCDNISLINIFRYSRVLQISRI